MASGWVAWAAAATGLGGPTLPFKGAGEFAGVPGAPGPGWEHARAEAAGAALDREGAGVGGGPGDTTGGSLRGSAGEVRCSVFRCRVPKGDARGLAEARNGVKRLKTLRHPGILRFRASDEREEGEFFVFHLVTEAVRPLLDFVRGADLGAQRGDYLAWGVRSMAETVDFLSQEGGLVHGAVGAGAVLVADKGLGWKLGFLDLLGSRTGAGGASEDGAFAQRRGGLAVPGAPAEVSRGDWDVVRDGPPGAVDAWGLGVLILEVHASRVLGASGELKEGLRSVPRELHTEYKGLLNSQPPRRLSPGDLLDREHFRGGGLGETLEFLDGLPLKSPGERARFFGALEKAGHKLPPALVRGRLLPSTASALAFGTAPPSTLGPFLQLCQESGAAEEPDFCDEALVPALARILGTREPGLRVELLSNVGAWVAYTSDAVVEQNALPLLQAALADADPALRDLGLKATAELAPKLPAKAINGPLLQALSGLQRDPEPRVRVNTTVLLSRLSGYLPESSARRVFLNAFARVLGDPYPPVRSAGLLALVETKRFYGPEEVAKRLLVVVAPLLKDPDPGARRAAFKCMETFFEELRSQEREEGLWEEETPGAAPQPRSRAGSRGSAGSSGGAPREPGTGTFRGRPEVDAVTGAAIDGSDDGWGDLEEDLGHVDLGPAAAAPAAAPSPPVASRRTSAPPGRGMKLGGKRLSDTGLSGGGELRDLLND